jgi:hypothetical protein
VVPVEMGVSPVCFYKEKDLKSEPKSMDDAS